LPLHSAVYATRPQAAAIVHLHSTYCVAVSMLPGINPQDALPPLTPYFVMRCGCTALVRYHRPGDPAVAEAIRALGGRFSCVLLANHGSVVAGPALDAAVFAAEELEETAKLFLLLRGTEARALSPANVDELAQIFG
jgi:ribulose-5-phosphate 4-epimerase/fuculose-1-phosphate aldolase